jgi:hypothetical protein
MRYGRKSKVYTDEFAKQYASALSATINDQLNYASDLVADFLVQRVDRWRQTQTERFISI